jgi:hypothetical protein
LECFQDKTDIVFYFNFLKKKKKNFKKRKKKKKKTSYAFFKSFLFFSYFVSSAGGLTSKKFAFLCFQIGLTNSLPGKLSSALSYGLIITP